jgi:hypothetical protein
VTLRSAGKGTLLWVFGLSVTVFLVSIWGRALFVDTEKLAEAVTPMSGSVPVVSIFTNWLGGELREFGAPPDVVDAAMVGVMARPEVSEALDRLVVEVVLAAGSSSPGEATVDVAGVLQPAAPAIAAGVSESTGGAVSQDQVVRVLDRLDPIVVKQEGVRPVVGPGSQIAGSLATATLLALIVMVISGGVAVGMSDDRLVAVKGLLARVALGALSFSVMLRIGSWVLSQNGGRAPVSATAANLFDAKWMVPLVIAAVAGFGVLVAWLLKRMRRHRGNGVPADRVLADLASGI